MIPKKEKTEIDIIRLKQGKVTFSLLGVSPLIYNCMSEKAKRDLLFPPVKKSAADKASTLKKDPLAEYRASVYRSLTDDAPTRLVLPATCFKAALCDVTLRVPNSGTSKTEVGQLTWVEGDWISVYGVPKMLISFPRVGMQKTPDPRTRAILPQWACTITVAHTLPNLKSTTVSNLLANAGNLMGVGDWRQEKGSGSYGRFEPVDPDDPRFVSIIEAAGRDSQDEALEHPECYDSDTANLYSWFQTEATRRGFKVA